MVMRSFSYSIVRVDWVDSYGQAHAYLADVGVPRPQSCLPGASRLQPQAPAGDSVDPGLGVRVYSWLG